MKFFREILIFVFWFECLWVGSVYVSELCELVDPAKTFYFWSGWLSLFSLLVGLFASKFGKFFGHCALLFALWHFVVFIGFDFGFAWDLVGQELFQKNYLHYGLGGLLLMLVLGGFSLAGKYHHRFTWIILLSAVLSLVHIILIQKIMSIEYWIAVLLACGCVLCKCILNLRKLKF